MFNIKDILNKDPDFNKAIQEFIKLYRQNLDNAVRSDSPLKNFKTILKFNKDVFQISILTEDYWYYMENGRLPGKNPPMQSILKWITVKRLIPRPNDRGEVPSAKQLAYAISKSIGEKGTTGKHVLKRTINQNQSLFNKIESTIKQSIGNEIVEEINYMLIEESKK